MTPRRVAGVAVSPDHFIGGERVASAERFVDLSPIDEQPLAEVARGGAREADLAARGRRERAFPAWAALGPAGRAEHLHRLADLIDANVERLAAVECLDMAMLLRSLRARVIGRGARNFRAYADLAVAHEERVWSSNGTANRVLRRPAGPGGRDHALERAVHALDLEDRAGARRRLHRRAQAGRVVAALGLAARRPRRTRPGSRRACSTSCRGSARRSAPRSSPTRASGGSRSPARPRPAALIAAGRGRGTSCRSRPSSAARARSLVFADADLEAAARTAAGQYDDAGQVCLAGTRLLVEEPVAERVPRALRPLRRRARPRRPARRRDDRLAADPPRAPRARRGLRRAGARERATRSSAAGSRSELGGLWYEPTLVLPALERERDRPARGLRAGADLPDASATRTRRSRSPTRRATASRRSSSRARPSGPSASAARSAPGRSG